MRDQNIFDAAVNYANDYDDFEVGAGLGYNWQDEDTSVFGGSASALHTPTGINFTFAGGKRNGAGSEDPLFWYSKLGLLRSYFPSLGDTAMSIDYYSGDDFGVDDAAGVTSSSSDSWGVAFVQNIDRANTQLWLTYRSYDYADDVASYDDGQAIFGGVFFSF